MGFIDSLQDKTKSKHKNSSDEILDSIGRKLPKKVRKKLHWKKIAPILRLLIAVVAYLSSARSDQQQRQSRSRPAADKRSSAAPSPQPAPSTSERFQDETLRGYVRQAEAYQVEIDRLAQNTTSASDQRRVQELAAHVQTWTTSVVSLAHRIENFKQNKLVSKDLKEVPKSIASLESRLADESDPAMRAELERTLANRRQQLTTLETLQRSIQMAEVKIESTLSMLGTIYSQILAGQSTREVADYRELVDEIDEEVHLLQDHLEALEEVKQARL